MIDNSLFYNEKNQLRWQFQRFLSRYAERPKVSPDERITPEDVDPEVSDWCLPELMGMIMGFKVKKSEILDKTVYKNIKRNFGKEWQSIHPTIKMGILLKEIDLPRIDQIQKEERKLRAATEENFKKIEQRVHEELEAKRKKKWGIKTEQEITNEFLKDRLKEVTQKNVR